jgi:hypothetical protein
VAPGCVLPSPSGDGCRTLSSGGNSRAATLMRESKICAYRGVGRIRVFLGRHGGSAARSHPPVLPRSERKSALRVGCVRTAPLSGGADQTDCASLGRSRTRRKPARALQLRRKRSQHPPGCLTAAQLRDGGIVRASSVLIQPVGPEREPRPQGRGEHSSVHGCQRLRRRLADSRSPAVQSLVYGVLRKLMCHLNGGRAREQNTPSRL